MVECRNPRRDDRERPGREEETRLVNLAEFVKTLYSFASFLNHSHG